MGRIGTALAFLASLAVVVALACTYERGAWNAPDGWIYEWQTLIAGALAVVSASIVVWVSKYIADQDIKQRRRAGRMHTADALQNFFWKCYDIVTEIANRQLTEVECSKPDELLPKLNIPHQIGDITDVSQVGDIFRFATSVKLNAENARRRAAARGPLGASPQALEEISGSSPSEMQDRVEAIAAYSALGAFQLRNRLVGKIWSQLTLPETRVNKLKMIVASARERGMFPDGTDFSLL